MPVIPGLSSGVGKMIYAGSIGTQIANELIDSCRCVVCIKLQRNSCIAALFV